MAPPRPLRHHVAYVLALVLVAFAGAGFAVLFRLALRHGMELVLGREDVLDAFRALPRVGRVVIPTLGGLGAGLAGLVAARTAGSHGVGAILEAVTLGRARLSLKATLWKALASFCALVTGGSLGREGSIVQLGATAGAVAARLGLHRRDRALVTRAATTLNPTAHTPVLPWTHRPPCSKGFWIGAAHGI